MLRNRFVVVLLALTTFASLGLVAADTYSIDPVHSFIIFKVKHMDASNLYGRFNAPTGTVVWDDSDPTKSSFEAKIEVNNIDTANKQRDGHLKGPDFFNAAEFPNITFKSTAVKKGAKDNTVEVTGDLNLHGQTKPVTFTLEKIGAAGGKIGFEGTLTIKQADYGMKPFKGVGEEIGIIIDIEAKK